MPSVNRSGVRGFALLALAGLVPAIASGGEGKWERSFPDVFRYGPGVVNHPVNILPPPDMVIPEGWPLDAGGAITCRTCHEEMPVGNGDASRTLRGGLPVYPDGGNVRTGFCANCHDDQASSSAADVHWIALGVAHVQPDKWRTTSSSGGLDLQSRRCLECHDGVNASEAQNVTPWNRGSSVSDPSTNHPVGVRYPQGKTRRADGTAYRPAGLLPKEILLPNDTVGCISCHNLYAQTPGLLSVPIEGSQLCFACHEMQ